MGACAQKFSPPPEVGADISVDELIAILAPLKCGTTISYDAIYTPLSKSDVANFMQFNTNLKYIKERYDCDDFSYSLVARVREWAYSAKGEGGIAFGIVSGNLRLTEDAPNRPHAVCFMIDVDKKIWLVDGMWNSMLAYPEDCKWMTFDTYQL